LDWLKLDTTGVLSNREAGIADALKPVFENAGFELQQFG
jgi:hypothetical protein